jgi:hypothetical protein
MNNDKDFYNEIDSSNTTIANISILLTILLGIMFVCYAVYRAVMG